MEAYEFKNPVLITKHYAMSTDAISFYDKRPGISGIYCFDEYIDSLDLFGQQLTTRGMNYARIVTDISILNEHIGKRIIQIRREDTDVNFDNVKKIADKNGGDYALIFTTTPPNLKRNCTHYTLLLVTNQEIDLYLVGLCHNNEEHVERIMMNDRTVSTTPVYI